MLLAQVTLTPSLDKGRVGEGLSWWQRLQHLDDPSPELKRAIFLLKNWLALADKLPVHDLLDRIYFEGDVLARYAAVLPLEMRAKTTANLHAFIEIALNVDAGRYPSLSRFLQELRELRGSADDAPDEGKLGSVGNAVRIYTVHEAKGLEAPIVWLLDVNAEQKNREGNDILLNWPPENSAPTHFSLYGDQASRGKKRAPLFELEAALQAREEMNLLYVAMTRARQALIVSGSSKGVDKEAKKKKPSWYDRIAESVSEQENSLLLDQQDEISDRPSARLEQTEDVLIQLPAIISTGKRTTSNTLQQQRGIWLHALLQYLTEHSPLPQGAPKAGNPLLAKSNAELAQGLWVREQAPNKGDIQQRLAIPTEEIESLWQQVQHLLTLPTLARFFDTQQYHAAYNEMPYVNAAGELKRIDRLVEFYDEIWVLDYKLGESSNVARYCPQMLAYQTAMQTVYENKTVRCALLFADGVIAEI
jgi:ATP-dependent helicase/nuclease subunit A